jgi:hypothetical protein
VAAKKKKRAREPEPLDALKARVMGKFATEVGTLQGRLADPKEVIQRAVLEALDDLLPE